MNGRAATECRVDAQRTADVVETLAHAHETQVSVAHRLTSRCDVEPRPSSAMLSASQSD